jgi:RimJ/RimL family protein N-acetyltransferase
VRRPADGLSDGVVTLRSPDDEDLDAIAVGIRDPDVVRWLGPPEGSAMDVLALNRRRAAAGSPTFCVCEGGDRCVGLAWLNRDDADRSAGSVGYWLLPEARGRGIATRAVRLLVAWTRSHGIRLVRLVTAADNASSRAVADRAGFREVERRRRDEPDGPDGEVVVYVLDEPPHAG